MSVVIRAFTLAALAFGAHGSAATAQSEDGAPEAQGAPGWSVTCASTARGLRCQALQSVILKKTRQRLVTAAISVPPDTTDVVMLLHLAHGIYLPAGVEIQVDKEKAQKLVVEFCDPKGCYARLPIDERQLTAMKNGKTMAISFQDLAKTSIRLEMSLNGFTAAYGKIN